MELNNQFVQDIGSPIRQSWNAVAEDMAYDEMINRDAIEIAIDADRLATFHSDAANDLLHEAIKEHGYSNVFAFLCKNIQLV